MIAESIGNLGNTIGQSFFSSTPAVSNSPGPGGTSFQDDYESARAAFYPPEGIQMNSIRQEPPQLADDRSGSSYSGAPPKSNNPDNQVSRSDNTEPPKHHNHRPEENEAPPKKEAPTKNQGAEKKEDPPAKNGRDTKAAAKEGKDGKLRAKKDGNEPLRAKQIEKLSQLIQNNHEKLIKLEKATEEATNQFTDTQKLTAEKNIEKVVLQELHGEKNVPKNSEVPEEPKIADETNVEKTGSKEAELDKKLLETVKTDPKTAKSETKDPHLNVTVTDLKADKPFNETRAQKLLLPDNRSDQPRVLQEQVVNTVEKGIKFLVTEGENKVNIQLQPPELGRVEVELLVKDSRVTAKINTESTAVKEVILSNLDQLKSNLENAGVSVNKFEVEVGGFKNHFDQHFGEGNSNGGKGGGKKGHSSDNRDPDQSDWLPDKIIRQQSYSLFQGNSVNYLV